MTKFGKNGKVMVAQQLQLLTELFSGRVNEFANDKNSRLVFTEFINIVNKSVLAFIAPTEDEVETYKQDMLDSYNVIKQMAELTNNSLAKEIADGILLDCINAIEFYAPHESIGNYCDYATAVSSGLAAM